MSRDDTVSCVALKKLSISSKTNCSWEVSSEISSGTSYGIVYQACCQKDCRYILKYQKFNLTDEMRPYITANTIKNEVEMQNRAAEYDLAPIIYDSWLCDDGGVIIMAPMKKPVSLLLEIYKTLQVRKEIIGAVFNIIEKLHSIGINHGDVHLDNIMVTYDKLPPSSTNEMKEYLDHDYVYKFIDFGVAEDLKEKEKYKQMIGDYSKVTAWLGDAAAKRDPTLVFVYEYAEEKTRKLAITYGLIQEDLDSDEEWT